MTQEPIGIRNYQALYKEARTTNYGAKALRLLIKEGDLSEGEKEFFSELTDDMRRGESIQQKERAVELRLMMRLINGHVCRAIYSDYGLQTTDVAELRAFLNEAEELELSIREVIENGVEMTRGLSTEFKGIGSDDAYAAEMMGILEWQKTASGKYRGLYCPRECFDTAT